MVSFEDGPAAGRVLALRCAPPLLRVVIDMEGTVDALDQLEDVPDPCEAVHVYRRVHLGGSMHLYYGGKNRAASGWYTVARYRLAEAQPDDQAARDTEQWRAWVQAHAAP